jgi:hypothetical protein
MTAIKEYTVEQTLTLKDISTIVGIFSGATLIV